MTTTTLDIYNLLVNAGIAEDKAQPLAKEILSRSEAKEILATKADLVRTENRLIIWMVGLQVASLGLLFASGVLG